MPSPPSRAECPSQAPGLAGLPSVGGRRVAELGAGPGLPGLAAAKLGATQAGPPGPELRPGPELGAPSDASQANSRAFALFGLCCLPWQQMCTCAKSSSDPNPNVRRLTDFQYFMHVHMFHVSAWVAGHGAHIHKAIDLRVGVSLKPQVIWREGLWMDPL